MITWFSQQSWLGNACQQDKTEGNRFFSPLRKNKPKIYAPFFMFGVITPAFVNTVNLKCILWDGIKLFSMVNEVERPFFAESKNNTAKYRWFAVSRFDSSRLQEFEGDTQWLRFNCMGVALVRAYFPFWCFITRLVWLFSSLWHRRFDFPDEYLFE